MRNMKLEDLLEEIRKRIAQAIADGDRELARTIFENEYRAAEEAKENLWECR